MMGLVQIRSLKNQALIADKCFVAERFFDRLRGLMGRAHLPEGEAMLFPRCNNVHMWFMRIPIDIVFGRLSNQPDGTRVLTITSTREGARPWSILPFMDLRASDALELPLGTIGKHALSAGGVLCLS